MSPLMHTDDIAVALPAARWAFDQVRAADRAHRYLNHVRSSQAFALNLFAPLDDRGVRRCFALLGIDAVKVEAPVFEYEDATDRIGEASTRSRHLTQVDVVLQCLDSNALRHRVLIEVKLGETDFGDCSAFQNPANDALDVCHQPGMFGGEPSRCFQLRNHGYGHRRYWDLLEHLVIEAPTDAADDGGCWVRADRSQPMRNLALGHLLIEQAEADVVTFALCAPSAHPTIWRRFEEFAAVLPGTDTVRIARARAEDVARLHEDEGATFFDRYGPALTGKAGGLALLHYEPLGELLGVWTQHAEQLTCYYRPGDDDGTGGSAIGENAVLGQDWDHLTERLPSSSPHVADWRALPCTPHETPHEIYQRLLQPVLPC
ncbi:hypothetical protein D9V37_16345 [Nocardioides mangrovicus]|uniref:Uncharacterized protein n=1 Tax=Nocardioides mangrovicus TaxID=2478913 RepID=A0A3L8NYI6_9ACTN|nr:hypothetical protein [Nocardioides mangrovicus]RLV47717.1 hypothetical protein D9V37_16345 [Nocardioides mangrovicus]